MQHSKNFVLSAAVITLKGLKNGNVLILDQQGDIRMIDLDGYKTVGGFKTNIKQERAYGSHMSASHSGKYVVIAVPNTNQTVMYDVPSKKRRLITSKHKGDVESVAVDNHDHYFVTGGTDGKTHVWNVQSGELIYTFPPHADYITALDINHNWVASACYDRSIALLNLTTMRPPIVLHGHHSVVVQIKILTHMRMISAEKEGQIILWDLHDSSIIARFPKIKDDITCFTLSEDEHFLYVGSKLGYVTLLDVHQQALIKADFIKEMSTITALCMSDKHNQLIVGTKEGDVNFYALAPDEASLLELIKHKDYHALYTQSIENPLIKNTQAYAQLEEIWELSFQKAQKMLASGQESNAKHILEPFSHVRHKQTIIQMLFQDYRAFAQFKNYVETKRYALAYPLANQYKNFRQSDPYLLMEKEWHLKFNKAKLLMTQKDGDEKVRQLLGNFKGISEKAILIQELFQQRTAYTLFQKKLIQKDFVALFALVKKCPFIKEFDEYDKLLEYADNTYIKTHQALEKRDYATALLGAKELMHVPEFKDDALQIITQSEMMQSFTKAFEENNIAAMYELIGEYPYLTDLPEAKVLEDEWDEHLQLAEKYASTGDVVNATAALEDFFDISAKFLPIANVLKQAYMFQLARVLRNQKHLFHVTGGIRQFVAFFGIDDNLKELIEQLNRFDNVNIDVEGMHCGDISRFTPSMIIPDIMRLA